MCTTMKPNLIRLLMFVSQMPQFSTKKKKKNPTHKQGILMLLMLSFFSLFLLQQNLTNMVNQALQFE